MAASPVLELKAWLQSLDQESQGHIAFLMTGICPIFAWPPSLEDFAQEGIKAFYARFDEFADEGMRGSGFIVSFRAAFDYLFAEDGTQERWDRLKQFWHTLLEKDDPDFTESMRARAHQSLAELPQRAEKWIGIIGSWNEFKASALADAVLRKWQNERVSIRPPVRLEAVE